MLSKETNGINAMLAHQSRVGDDNNFVRSMIESYMFLGFGVVTKIDGVRLSVDCGWRKFTNVELMVLGVDGWGLKMLPAVNDRVLLLSTQVPVQNLQTFTASGSMPPYDPSGVKAIPITDVSSAQLITVDKNGIKLTGDVKIDINKDGVRVEDKNQNILQTSSSGIEIDDTNGNKIIMGSSNVTINNKLEIGR